MKKTISIGVTLEITCINLSNPDMYDINIIIATIIDPMYLFIP